MLFTVSRNGQTYGPYTLEDLQRYVASGNVLLTDMARAEGATEWVPVSQLLGSAGAGVLDAAGQDPVGTGPAGVPYAPVAGPGAPPSYYGAATAQAYNDPPNISWGLLLVIALFTCSLFMYVWNIVLAAWMKRVNPRSNAIYFYIGVVVLLFIQMISSASVHVQPGNLMSFYTMHPLRNLVGIAAWVTKLIARFVMRSDLEEHYNTVEPVGLRLSPVMTFFFGGLYFQYHLNRINEMKRMARYRGAAI